MTGGPRYNGAGPEERIMPIHGWTRVEAGIFHHFHQRWIGAMGDALNGGLLPADYFALSEQVTGAPVPDVVTLRLSPAAPPDRVAIRHASGLVVSVVEIVSPGNKDSKHSIRAFTEKAAELLRQCISLLVVDLFPPTPRDPQGIHKAIWDTLCDEPYEQPPDCPLTCVAYSAGAEITAYVQPTAVGEALPAMPVFLGPETYVSLDLDVTYTATWAVFPAPLKGSLTA